MQVVTRISRLRPEQMHLLHAFLAARNDPNTSSADLDALSQELIKSMDTQLVQVRPWVTLP